MGCLYDDILILGKSPIKWRLRPDMTLAVDWDVKYQFKQTFYMFRDNIKDVYKGCYTMVISLWCRLGLFPLDQII